MALKYISKVDCYNCEFSYGITQEQFVAIFNDKVNFDDEIIQMLMKKYKKLNLNYDSFDLKRIPDYITHLSLQLSHYEDCNFDILSNNIEFLYIDATNADNGFNKPLDNLPSNLKELHIISENFNQSLDYLPINLKILRIDSNEFCQPINNLPVNLHTLVVCCVRHYQGNLIIKYGVWDLPENLKYLIVQSPKKSFNYIKGYNSNIKIQYVDYKHDLIN